MRLARDLARLVVLLAIANSCLGQRQEESLAGVDVLSPDRQLRLAISANPTGPVCYQVEFRGKPVIQTSALGLELEGAPVLGDNMRVVSAERSSADQTYNVVSGKSNPVREHYNSVLAKMQETTRSGRRLWVEARAYDDGVAFRYVVPEQPRLTELRLTRERTHFVLSKDGPSYPLYLPSFRNSYEGEHSTVPVSGMSGSLVGLPLLVELPGVAWVALTEAHLENYAGMYLVHPAGHRPKLEARLSPRLDQPELSVIGVPPFNSPWRVLMVADDPGRFIESNLVVNLNPPSALSDTSWIKPGKKTSTWWPGSIVTGVDFQGGMNAATMKYYTDFAARSNISYLVIDAGWYRNDDVTDLNPQLDLPDVIRHAKERGVGIWLWVHWAVIDRQMEMAFPLFAKWGVAGVKLDFMQRDDQAMVNFYQRVVKNAAKHKLLIDLHGAYKPTGLRRTYPNLMAHEAALGFEYAKWSARSTPAVNVMLAFTRMLAGPMSIGVGGFNNATPAEFVPRSRAPMVLGTRAHHLALYVVFENPFAGVVDHPGAYENQPEFEFIRRVPTAWDETRVLNGQAGKYVTIARRRGQEWYIGSITDWDARQFEVPLNFLGDGSYAAEIYADASDAAANPKHVLITRNPARRAATLKFALAPGGGCAVRLIPAQTSTSTSNANTR